MPIENQLNFIEVRSKEQSEFYASKIFGIMLFRKIFIVLHKNEVNRIPNDAENVFCRSDYLKHLINKRTHNLITPNPKETSIKAKELLFIENNI